MKVAIVHDYIKEYGGAEKVVEALLEVWPKADIYTSIFSPKYLGPHAGRFEKYKIHTSFMQTVPFNERIISFSRFLGPLIFKSFDLSGYDVVISSQAGTYVSPNFVKTGKNTLHITYCHTPPRWLYGYVTAGGWEHGTKKIIKKFLGTIPMHFLRLFDFDAAQLPDYYVANSEETAKRIEKFYRRDSKVIYPPVDITADSKIDKKDFFLTGGRLARPKRIDLAVKVFTELELPLKVYGKEFSGYGAELRKIAGPNIEFLGEISEDYKFELMRESRAFIFPAEQEDFGITPVEAMGAGTPVVAAYSGGVKESVIEGLTGVFFEEHNVDSLKKAVRKFIKISGKIKPEDCVQQAQKFSKDRFKRDILKFVQNKLPKK